MKNLNEYLISEKRETRFAKVAKQCVKDQGNDWDDEAYFDSADQWMEDHNILSEEALKAVWHVLSSLAEGDDPKKYIELADKFWQE